MATSPTSPGSSPNAAVVIRERIKQKRLFEAQFLFGLLDEDDVSPQERLVLERELNGLLAVVRDLQIQANKYLAEGEYTLARKMHREMERIAVDVPGLEYGKRQAEARAEAREDAPPAQAAVRETAPPVQAAAVQEPAPAVRAVVQETVLPDLVAEPPQSSPPPPEEEVAEILWPVDDAPEAIPETEAEEPAETMETVATEPEEAPEPRAAVGKKPSGSPQKKLLLAAAILLAALLGLLLMKAARHEAPAPQAEVAIKPLSVRQSDDADRPPAQTPPHAEGTGSGSITIGELTVEE